MSDEPEPEQVPPSESAAEVPPEAEVPAQPDDVPAEDPPVTSAPPSVKPSAAKTPTASLPKIEEPSAEDPETQPKSRNLSQSTRSYMFLDSAEQSVLYEKDGTWVLEKIPDDIKDELKNQDADKDGSCKNQDPDKVREPHIVPIDALSGNETIPCNLCDKGQCMPESELAPAWIWMYDMTTQMIALANEYKRNMLQSDVGCGESDNSNGNIDDRMVASKGTQHSTAIVNTETDEPAPPEPSPEAPADPPPEAPADPPPEPESPVDPPPEIDGADETPDFPAEPVEVEE